MLDTFEIMWLSSAEKSETFDREKFGNFLEKFTKTLKVVEFPKCELLNQNSGKNGK